MPRLLPALGAQRLLLAALAATVLRWALIAELAMVPAAALFAQTLHLASFGICHAVAMYYIHRFFTGPHQGRGQGLYSSLSFGAGGALGSLLAGYGWAAGGGELIYLGAAGFQRRQQQPLRPKGWQQSRHDKENADLSHHTAGPEQPDRQAPIAELRHI